MYRKTKKEKKTQGNIRIVNLHTPFYDAAVPINKIEPEMKLL